MARNTSRPAHLFAEGTVWSGPGGNWRLISLQPATGVPRVANAVTFVCEDPMGDRHELTMNQLLTELHMPMDFDAAHVDEIALFEEDLGCLRPDERDDLRRLREFILIWICGDPEGDLQTEMPRKGIAPHPLKRPPVGQGRTEAQQALLKHMAASGMKMSRAEFAKNQRALELANGSLLGLLTKRQRKRVFGPLVGVPDELRQTFEAYVTGVAEDNTKDLGAHYEDADAHMRDKTAFDPVDYPQALRERVVRELLRGRRAKAAAGSRASKAARPDGVQGSFVAAAPYEQVQIDGWDLPVFVTNQYGEEINTACLVAIDVCTRIILAILLVPKAYTAEDVALLIFETRKGGDIWPGAEAASPALPRDVLVAGPVLQRLGESANVRNIGNTGVDNGLQMVGLFTLRALRDIGSNVDIAPPGTGVAKAIIEAFFRHFGIVVQSWSGAKGRSAHHRGRHRRVGTPVPRYLMEAALRMYIDLVYHNIVHRSLGMTPHDKLVLELVTAGAIPVDVNPAVAWQLLPRTAKGQVVNDEGISVAGAYYDHPDIQEMKRHTQGDDHFDSRPVSVRYNPYDPYYVLIRDLNGRVRQVPLRSLDSPQPPLQDVRALLTTELRLANDRPKDFRRKAVALIRDALLGAASILTPVDAPSGRRSTAAQASCDEDLWADTFNEVG